MKSRATLLPSLALLAPLASGGAAQTSGWPVADERIQTEIRRALEVRDEAELLASNASLRELGGRQHELLVPQLFLFSSRGTSTREAMAFGGLRDRLRIPPLAIVRALVPYLDGEDARLRTELAGVLAEYEHHDVDHPPSFAVYRPLLDEALRAGEEPPTGLVRHLYATHPGQALLTMMRVFERDPAARRPIRWAERTVANELWKRRFGFSRGPVDAAVSEELAAMAAHPAWWARLFAAAVMTREPVLRDEALLRALAQDEHALVRRAGAPPGRSERGDAR
jgi:hypothetical protein